MEARSINEFKNKLGKSMKGLAPPEAIKSQSPNASYNWKHSTWNTVKRNNEERIFPCVFGWLVLLFFVRLFVFSMLIFLV